MMMMNRFYDYESKTAVGTRFELVKPFGLLTFQASAFDHSANPP